MLSNSPSGMIRQDITAADVENTSSVRAVATIAGLLFLSMVPVTMLVAPLKELIADRFAASSFWTHSFMSVNMIGALVAAPIIGFLADRSHLRRVIVASALLCDGILLAGMSFVPSLATVLAVRFLEGATHILAISTFMGIAAGWAKENQRGRTMGLIGAAMMFGTACGTRLGGALYLAFPGQTFVIAGAISGLTGVLAFFAVRESPRHAKHDNGVRQVLGLLKEYPSLWTAYAYSFIDRLSIGVVITTFGFFLANVHQLNPGARSHLLLVFLLPFSLLVYPAGRLVDRIGRVWPLAMGSIAFGFIFASYGFMPSRFLWVSMALSGIVSAVMFAPNLTLVADLAPSSHRGAAFAGFNIAGNLGFMLGPLFSGTMFSLVSRQWPDKAAYEATFLATGLLVVVCALVTFPLLQRAKRSGLTW